MNKKIEGVLLVLSVRTRSPFFEFYTNKRSELS